MFLHVDKTLFSYCISGEEPNLMAAAPGLLRSQQFSLKATLSLCYVLYLCALWQPGIVLLLTNIYEMMCGNTIYSTLFSLIVSYLNIALVHAINQLHGVKQQPLHQNVLHLFVILFGATQMFYQNRSAGSCVDRSCCERSQTVCVYVQLQGLNYQQLFLF